jgi:hypothetical protein
VAMIANRKTIEASWDKQNAARMELEELKK